MNNPFIAGVDIGGSHITAALVDLSTSTLVPGTLLRVSISPSDSAETIIDTWCATIQKTFRSHPSSQATQKIGMAMPGPFDYEKGISFIRNQGKYESLYGLNIKELMAARLNITPADIRMMNDALCFLQGEVAGGAVNGYDHALGLTLGTGLGSAIYRDGVCIDADLWHAPFKNGIAEDYLSSRWFVKRYSELTGQTIANTKALTELIPSDPSIKSIFLEFAGHLAEFLAGTVLSSHPEVIVLGGNISKSYRLFLPELENALRERAVQVPLRIAMLGENAHIIGGASCWRSSL